MSYFRTIKTMDGWTVKVNLHDDSLRMSCTKTMAIPHVQEIKFSVRVIRPVEYVDEFIAYAILTTYCSGEVRLPGVRTKHVTFKNEDEAVTWAIMNMNQLCAEVVADAAAAQRLIDESTYAKLQKLRFGVNIVSRYAAQLGRSIKPKAVKRPKRKLRKAQ